MAVGAFVAAGLAGGPAPAQTDAAALFEARCGVCHGTDRPKSRRKTAEGWARTVARMQGKGAPITDEEARIIVDYLSENYGK